jgi:hypothetical protein
MPQEVEDRVDSIMDENPEMDEETAYAIAWDDYEGDSEKRATLAKSAPFGEVAKMEFEVAAEGSVGIISKADNEFLIWGPASVEVVDKEQDRIKAEALEDALPQLLKRSRLSYEHSDQLVGDILERFETDEAKAVKINGQTFNRTEFPTDVLKLDGMEPALYVAGNIYADTQKSREVRDLIKQGEIDSYSISGEAVVTEMAVKDGRTFTDIKKLDLSAVTLCRTGMNPKAKFDTVAKSEGGSLNPQQKFKTQLEKSTMGDENDNDVQKFVDAAEDVIDKKLPDGDLATKDDVEDIVDERLKAQEGSPENGTASRPDGNSDNPTETDPEFEGDNPGEETVGDPDKVEETKSGDVYTKDELKSLLPDDQYKAVEAALEEGPEEEEEMEQPMPPEEGPEEEVEPEPMMEEEPDEEEGEEIQLSNGKTVKWGKLSDDQKKAVAKSGALEKTGSGVQTAVGVENGVTEPSHAGSGGSDGDVAKADNESIAADPAAGNFYDDDGEPKV